MPNLNQLGTNFGPTWGELGANLDPKWAQLGLDLGLQSANADFSKTYVLPKENCYFHASREPQNDPKSKLKRTWGQLGSTWADSGQLGSNLEATWVQLGPTLVTIWDSTWR